MSSNIDSRHLAASSFICNGIDGSTGAYLIPPLGSTEIVEIANGTPLPRAERADLERKTRLSRQENFGIVQGADPNDLAQAGWAVIFSEVPQGSEAAVRQLAIRNELEPLLAHRRAQASARRESYYQEYVDDRGYKSGETAMQYLTRLGAAPGPANPDNVPYYLLLVASPDEIPYRVQYQIDIQYAVGRIYFPTVDEYGHYARSVVEAETGAVVRARRATFFAPANPDDLATELSHEHLAIPLADFAASETGWTVERAFADQATRARLEEMLREVPALLFTAGHGMGFPSGHASQLDHQGALLCQDWDGPKAEGVRRGDYFAGEDLPRDVDLRGMIGFNFACFGAGTPARDQFIRRALDKAEASVIAPHSLVARLPQCMLGHPRGGALAVIGHVDRAWVSSFIWSDPRGEVETIAHRTVFESSLKSLMEGRRVGYALEYFNIRYAELAAHLAERIDEIQTLDTAYDNDEIARMWTQVNDTRNYAIVGDPAVCFPATCMADGEPGPVPGPAPNSAADWGDTGTRPIELETGPADGASAPDAGPGTIPRAVADQGDTRTGPVEMETGPADGASAPDAVGPEGAAGFVDEPGRLGARGGAKMPADGEGAYWFGNSDKDGLLKRLGTKVTEILGQVVADAVTLEVKTYVSSDLQQTASRSDELSSDANTRLRAYTRCGLDGDTEVYVPVDANGEIDQALWALHAEMVKQAQAHRNELFKTALSVLRPLIDD